VGGDAVARLLVAAAATAALCHAAVAVEGDV
jgi:hypothetical protein